MSDPDLIKHVTVTKSKNYVRSSVLKNIIPSIGNGLFSSNGKEHARQRKMINPAFNYSNLTGMVGDFEDISSNLVKVGYNSLSEAGRIQIQSMLTCSINQ